MENVNVSVILPVESSKHKNFLDLFTNAVLSVKQQTVGVNELVIVHSDEESLVNIIKGFDFSGLTVNLIENTGDTDFATQMNLGVKNAKSDWVSFLEFDDEYASIWFKNVKRYMSTRLETFQSQLDKLKVEEVE